jgi:hypothetical protein
MQLSETKRPAGSDHLIELADGWLLWKAACLRGAGLPVHWLERLAAPEASAEIDCLVDLEAAREDAVGQALEACRAALATLAPKSRKGVQRAIKALGGGRVPGAVLECPQLSALFDSLARAAAECDAASARVEATLAAGRRQVFAALQDIGREPLFREALIWQNRQALHDSVDVLLRMDSAVENTARRRHEITVCNYVQRYCAKNDTIGFFGPAAWFSFADSGPPLTMKPGPALVAERQVHFEYWAVDALAEVLGQDKDLLPWLAPRLHPRLRLDGEGRLQVPGREPRRLRPEVARVIAACDGRTPAREIAVRIAGEQQPAFPTPAEVLRQLSALARSQIVVWNAAAPIIPPADRWLRGLLGKVGHPEARQRALAKLDVLQRGRAAVAAARGDPAALDAAMAALEGSFRQITRSGATRHAGKTYGGRTLLYEDCRRDVEVVLGPEVRQRLGPPFALLLQGANWYLDQIGSRFAAYLDSVFDRFCAAAGGAPVGLQAMVLNNAEVWRRGAAIVDQAVAAHAQRWQSVLDLDVTLRQARFTVSGLRERVDAAFPPVPLHWAGARYHSPDLMIAAESAEAVGEGRYQLVLGEFNAGINRLAQPLFCLLHPQPLEIARFLDADLQRPRALLLAQRQSKGHRVVFDTIAPRDYHIAFVDTPSWRAPEYVLPASELVVERAAEGLVVRTRDGSRRFNLADLYTMTLGRHYWEKISLLPACPHLPRIVFDDLVVEREKWRLACRDIAFAGLRSPEQRFVAARRWMRGLGLPRWVFARFAFENKPIYVDFASPVSVDAFARLLRRGAEEEAGTVAVSEMLPTPEQCWLADAEGNRYTSELRLAALHPEPWYPRATPAAI